MAAVCESTANVVHEIGGSLLYADEPTILQWEQIAMRIVEVR